VSSAIKYFEFIKGFAVEKSRERAFQKNIESVGFAVISYVIRHIICCSEYEENHSDGVELITVLALEVPLLGNMRLGGILVYVNNWFLPIPMFSHECHYLGMSFSLIALVILIPQ
jgi:hypothetical protein